MSGIFTIVGSALHSVGSLVGVRSGTDEPAYTVDLRTPAVEVRHYGERVVAETTVTGDEEAARSVGFRRLAGYIFGGNHARAKFAMTAPVAQNPAIPNGQRIAMAAPVGPKVSAPGQWVIRFFLPADVVLDSLPEPNNPAVQLVAVPAETIAVHTFSGDRGPRAVKAHSAQLLTALHDTDFQPVGTPQAWFYDPPWTIPQFRRNEIAVPVIKKN